MPVDLLRRMFRAFLWPIFALVLILGVGTAGFVYIAGPKTTPLDALYMTYITIFTIGYGEIVDLQDSPGGRVFNMLVATVGIAVVAYLTAKLTAFIVQADIDQLLRRKRMLDKIQKLSGHYIICGIGRVGTNVLDELLATGRESVVIEPAPEALEELAKNYPQQLWLRGDGATDDVLQAAGVARAAGVFAVSGDDGKNLVITLSVKQLNPNARIVARCHDVQFVDKIRRVGADDIVSPDFTGALRIASSMLRPAVVSFLDEMLRSDQGLRIEEIAIPEAAAERRLDEIAPPDPAYVVLALRRAGRWHFNPRAEERMRGASILVVMATPEGCGRMQRLLSA